MRTTTFSFFRLFAAVILLCTVILAAAPEVLVRNRRLFVDENEFFMKAVVYNPVPLGAYRVAPDGTSKRN